MAGAAVTEIDRPAIEPEDALRAQLYRLLSSFLCDAPSRQLLEQCCELRGDDSELGQAINTLAKLAGDTSADEALDEYNALFIGIGRGELVPFGSYYLTGFLNEKPLAKLRNDMRDLGIARRAGVSDPEDHIAALCEMMAGLISGDFDKAADLETQKSFFDKHIASWAPHFFEDLRAARKSRLYLAVGAIGAAFMQVELAAFRMGTA